MTNFYDLCNSSSQVTWRDGSFFEETLYKIGGFFPVIEGFLTFIAFCIVKLISV